jgi:hypothetical protein
VALADLGEHRLELGDEAHRGAVGDVAPVGEDVEADLGGGGVGWGWGGLDEGWLGLVRVGREWEGFNVE